jgi:hypothetical protein
MYIFFQLLEKYRLMNSLPASDYGGTGRFVQISVNMNVFTDSSDNLPNTLISFIWIVANQRVMQKSPCGKNPKCLF